MILRSKRVKKDKFEAKRVVAGKRHTRNSIATALDKSDSEETGGGSFE
jgi:hypothetical protein